MHHKRLQNNIAALQSKITKINEARHKASGCEKEESQEDIDSPQLMVRSNLQWKML